MSTGAHNLHFNDAVDGTCLYNVVLGEMKLSSIGQQLKDCIMLKFCNEIVCFRNQHGGFLS